MVENGENAEKCPGDMRIEINTPGTVSSGLARGLLDLEIRGRAETIQTKYW